MVFRVIILTFLFGISALLPKSFVSSKISPLGLPLAPEGKITTVSLPEPSFTLDPLPNLAPMEAEARSGLLFDVKQKKITWEKDMKTSYPIASLTKMMVALLTIEDILVGKFSWDTKVKVTPQAALMRGSKVFLRRGEVFSVRELMKSAMIASGNDACYLLAQYNGGSEKNFVARMNKRAAQLGMRSTSFSNSTGLPVPNGMDNMSSAYDLLLLSNEILKYPQILEIASKKEEYIKHGKRQYAYRNHNKLVIEYEYEVDGLKTGFTNRAGFCIVATSNKSNHRLISIVLGVKKSVTRNMIAADLMNNYYSLIGLGKMGDNYSRN